VTLADSAELEVSEVAGAIYSICVCADEAKTFRWDVKATNLGMSAWIPCPATWRPPDTVGWTGRASANMMPSAMLFSAPFIPSPSPPIPTQPVPFKAHGAAVWAGASMVTECPIGIAGEVNITISTEAISSEELCGNEKPVVPAQGRVDTVIKPLLVQVRQVMGDERGMRAEQTWGCDGKTPSRCLGSGTAPSVAAGMALGDMRTWRSQD